MPEGIKQVNVLSPELLAITNKIARKYHTEDHVSYLKIPDDATLLRSFMFYAKDDKDLIQELLILGCKKAIRSRSYVPAQKEQLNKLTTATREKKVQVHRARRNIASKLDIDIDDVPRFAHEQIKMMKTLAVKAETLDKVVELLDTWIVDGKQLGDCTRLELLRASKVSSVRATKHKKDSELFAELAEVLGTSETLRASKKRVAIIKILEKVMV